VWVCVCVCEGGGLHWQFGCLGGGVGGRRVSVGTHIGCLWDVQGSRRPDAAVLAARDAARLEAQQVCCVILDTVIALKLQPAQYKSQPA
jgi:hypothetical protein